MDQRIGIIDAVLGKPCIRTVFFNGTFVEGHVAGRKYVDDSTFNLIRLAFVIREYHVLEDCVSFFK